MPTSTSQREKPHAFGRLPSVLHLGMVVCTLALSLLVVSASTGESTFNVSAPELRQRTDLAAADARVYNAPRRG
jgi:hypothetical protein